ncbi:MAG TPA: DUF3300 domain-containing protein [Terriglobales bacterium]|nr:DUF3300 domain-containing protein [Terriglobales bacterium]
MNSKHIVSRNIIRSLLALLCCVLLAPGEIFAYGSYQPTTSSQASSTTQPAAKIPPDQLDSLVAPIALYPDPMLAQTLAASTYPLELIQLQQWLTKNKSLKDKALLDAVSKQPWDPAVQAMAALPDVVKRLTDDVQWTTDLGNAFLAQQSEVMDAVQRMRKKAQDTGNLKSSEQQKVETKVVESKQIIVVEQAQPQVVYVPSYNPTVVYGPPVYPYPPIYYPPAGYYAAGMAISFGIGIAMGAAWGGGWGWGAGWGGNNDITINRNNSFNRNTNVSGGNRTNIGNGNRGGNSWQHNPSHRGGTPYGDRGTANKFGGTTRGDSLANRQSSARQQVGRQQGNVSNRASGVSSGNRGGGAGVSDRSAGGSRAGVSDRSAGGSRGGGGGADSIGSRDVSRGSSGGGGNRSAFGGGSGSYSGSSARSSGSRGSSSMGSRGGGGGGSRGGGGGRGGGRRR